MSSIIIRPNGDRWLQFKNNLGKRPTIRLGQATEQQAFDFKSKVDQLLTIQKLAAPMPYQLSKWLADLTPEMYTRLVAVGLVEQRSISTVGELLAAWEASREWKSSTRASLRSFIRSIKEYFGNAPLFSITEARARDYAEHLKTTKGERDKTLSKATISRRIGRAKEVFRFAVKRKALLDNPFDDVKRSGEVNRSRDFYVTRDVIDKVLAESDIEFRALIALARFGAARCPSEVLPMTWFQVHWADNTMTVISPKTEHHEGMDQRTVPIFPELLVHLRALWDVAPEGQSLLFPNHQMTNAGLSGKLQRMLRHCGIPLWVKPWQNMRSTRETEWLEEYPIHKVAHWLGHSPEVALRHYAQIVTERSAKDVNATQSTQTENRKSDTQHEAL
jgi:integrase